MICSCGTIMGATVYVRTEPGQPREVRPAERCHRCGRVEWLDGWKPAPEPEKVSREIRT